MPGSKPKPKPKPLGPPLSLTDDDLEAMSQISPADLKAAVALWDEESGLAHLLQATPMKENGSDNNSTTAK